MSTKLITENLSWQYLKEHYHIGTVVVNGAPVKINELQEAIDDGTILSQIEQCADEFYGGDTKAVIDIMKRNVSSALCNTKKRPDTPTKARDLLRIDMVRSFLANLSATTVAKSTRNASGKSYADWTMEEIMAVPLDDLRTLQSLRDNLASRLSKYPERIEDMDEFRLRYKTASERYSEAKRAAKQSATKPAVNEADVDKLLGALQKGHLTKADKELLAQVLHNIKK